MKKAPLFLTVACVATALLVSAPAPPAMAAIAASPDLSARIDQEIERTESRIVELRHQIHQYPELSNREEKTAALVAEHLRSLGLDVETGIAHTGVVGILRGGPGPVVAVRADMDALPVTEATDLAFASTERTTFLGQEVGVAHACGHDIHTSAALGVASVLSALGDDLPGTVVFVFQPAEEGPPPGEEGGAPLMLDEGVFEPPRPRPEAIFALHAFSDFEVGEVGLNPGPTMASVDQFRATLTGKQAHGAYPHLGIDPVVMAAQAILSLQTIRSRTLPALTPSVVTVGIVRGGERFNIIPESVHLEGTVRTYDDETRATVERRMHEILDGVARAGGGSYQLDYVNNAPATVNDDALTAFARRSLERTLGEESVYTTEPTMGGEDFAYFARVIPGFYYRLGVVEPGTESGAIHTPTFRASDDAVAVGMRTMANLVIDYLTATSGTDDD